MKKQRQDGQQTRQKMLAAASECFALNGFWETTNADICEKAEVNTASVNYHFGSKENLYVQAWKYSFDESIRKHPPDGGVPPQATVEEKFRGRIKSIIERVIDPEACDFDIIHKEMASPTGLLTETIETAIIPIENEFMKDLKELLGSDVSQKELMLCHMSIMSQCFGPMLHLRHIQKKSPVPHPRDLRADISIEELTEHIIRFSLAGMKTYIK